MTEEGPMFHNLDRAEAEALLRRHHVGRIAFAWRDRVDIQPISYVYEGGMVHGRTSFGTKLGMLAHVPWVAFETDDVKGPLDWQSVVVHGTFFVVDPDTMRREYDHTLELLRGLVPQAMTGDDPTPERNVLFRIDVQEMSGRAATRR
ncbi:MAG: pyridoxamine 5'-phosphate oxidase family protein [Gemmatimonadales bacterium]|nr:pyridoxamine 5'-phosphate oxidase family protein [Gemmatimonadales bacterium]